MEIRIQYDCKDIDWQIVSDTLKSVGMAFFEPEKHKRAFEASHTTVFVFDAEKLVGFGRAISDGVCQAAVYCLAVNKAYQGKGIGRIILEKIMARLPECNVILYSNPGKEGFYEKLGFRRLKTGMALFKNRERMIERGFTD